jgi:hypothetical protein
MINVFYTDGSEETYKSRGEAVDGIESTVIGCDFATTVMHVAENGKALHCTWSVSLDRFEDL